jgi:hypothetical protein
MGDRVAIEGHPFSQIRQAVREVEGSPASTRIVARELLSSSYILDAEEALQKSMQRDRDMALAASDYTTFKTELKISRRLETDFFRMKPKGHLDQCGPSGCRLENRNGRVRSRETDRE